MEFVALYKIIPLALICLLGFVCVFFSMFTKEHINAISKLAFNVLIPLFLFQSTRQADLNAALSWQWFFTFYASIVVLFFVTFGYHSILHGKIFLEVPKLLEFWWKTPFLTRESLTNVMGELFEDRIFPCCLAQLV